MVEGTKKFEIQTLTQEVRMTGSNGYYQDDEDRLEELQKQIERERRALRRVRIIYMVIFGVAVLGLAALAVLAQ